MGFFLSFFLLFPFYIRNVSSNLLESDGDIQKHCHIYYMKKEIQATFNKFIGAMPLLPDKSKSWLVAWLAGHFTFSINVEVIVVIGWHFIRIGIAARERERESNFLYNSKTIYAD